MAVCPACGSSRIRNDYKPAPLWLRLFGVRALLCDYCNLQFRAFAPLPPKSRRHPPHKADLFNAAPVVDLRRLNRPDSEAQAGPAQVINLRRPAQPVTEQITPVRNDLRTQITRLYSQNTQTTAEQSAPTKTNVPPAAATQFCPECGSHNVKRRHRNSVEKAVLAFTDHKAYVCRNCGASFYAKGASSYAKDGESCALEQGSAERSSLESSSFNRECRLPERKR